MVQLLCRLSMQEMLVTTLDDLTVLAERVLSALRDRGQKGTATVLALHGELGAGKTTFTQVLAGLLGVEHYVTSPTFVVMRMYPIPHAADNDPVLFSQLVHIDAYRIGSPAELDVIGFEELLCDPTNLICIEWAGKVAAALPKDAFHITFTHGADGGERAPRKVVYGYTDTDEREKPDAHPNGA